MDPRSKKIISTTIITSCSLIFTAQLTVLPLLQAMKSGMNPGHMTIRLLKSTSASPAALARTVTLLPKWPEDTRRNVDDEQNAVMPCSGVEWRNQ